MFLALLITAAAQAQFIDLEGTGDDDRPRVAAFTPAGDAVLVAHATGGITHIPFAGGPVTHATVSARSYEAIEFTPNGNSLVCADYEGARVDVYSAAGFVLQASIPLGINDGNRLIVGLGSRHAVVVGLHSAVWLDLVAGVQLSSVVLPPFDGPSTTGTLFERVSHRAVLTADDRTLVALEVTPAQRRFHAIDLSTGITTVTGGAVNTYSQHFVGTSGDRRRVLEVYSRNAPAWTAVNEYDSRTLQLLETTLLFNVTLVTDFAVDATASRCVLTAYDTSCVFPLDGATHAPTLPSTTTIHAQHSWQHVVSRDLTQLLALGATPVLFDTTGAVRARLDPALVWILTKAATSTAGAASGPRFALLTFERAALIEAGPSGPAGLARNVNTGVGAEQDGSFVPALVRGTDRALVLAQQSDVVLDVDLDLGTVLGALPVGRGPITHATRADGVLLVGCEDGTVVRIDPVGFVELGRFQVGGDVVELACEPTGTGAWLRIERSASDELVRIDTAATVPTPSVVIPLRGRAGQRSVARPHRGGAVVFDFARQRAVAASATSYPPWSSAREVEWIDLAQGIVIDRAPGFGFALALAPAGDRVYVGTGGYPGDVQAFDLTATAMTERWHVATTPEWSPGEPWRVEGLALSAAGDVVFANLTVDPQPFTTSAGFVALDADSGAILDSLGDVYSVGSAMVEGTLVIGTSIEVHLVRFDASPGGGSFGPVEVVDSPVGFTGDPVVDAARGRLVFSTEDWGQTPQQGGLVVLDLLDSRTSVHCTGGAPNATGVQATLTLEGSPFAGGELTAVVAGLEPLGMFGVVLVGDAVSAPTPLPGSVGDLCVGGTVGRLVGPPLLPDASGVQRHMFSTAPLVTTAGATLVQPGDTFTFQLWHRDTAPGGAAVGNTSTAMALTFR
jgi:outer membrane protein assembly factor BamB